MGSEMCIRDRNWPLQRPYHGPFPAVSKNDKTFTLRIRGKDQTISVDRQKPAYFPTAPPVSQKHFPVKTRVITRYGRYVRPPARLGGRGCVVAHALRFAAFGSAGLILAHCVMRAAYLSTTTFVIPFRNHMVFSR